MSLSEGKQWTTGFESNFHVPGSTKVVGIPHTGQGPPRVSQRCKESPTHETSLATMVL